MGKLSQADIERALQKVSERGVWLALHALVQVELGLGKFAGQDANVAEVEVGRAVALVQLAGLLKFAPRRGKIGLAQKIGPQIIVGHVESRSNFHCLLVVLDGIVVLSLTVRLHAAYQTPSPRSWETAVVVRGIDHVGIAAPGAVGGGSLLHVVSRGSR